MQQAFFCYHIISLQRSDHFQYQVLSDLTIILNVANQYLTTSLQIAFSYFPPKLPWEYCMLIFSPKTFFQWKGKIKFKIIPFASDLPEQAGYKGVSHAPRIFF